MVNNKINYGKKALLIIIQVALLCALWILANQISQRFLPAVPASILGLFMLLLLLFLGVPQRFFNSGANWLISQMLLFFIPALVSVIKYQDIILKDGVAIITIICISTLMVMVSTALVVEGCYHWQIRHRRKSRLQKRRGK